MRRVKLGENEQSCVATGNRIGKIMPEGNTCDLLLLGT